MARISKLIWLGLAILIPMLLLTFSARAQVSNISKATRFTSVQTAIDAACTGDVLLMEAGIYKETLIINKPITLKGSGETNTILDVSEAKVQGITINSNMVSIDTFSVLGSSVNDNHCIYYVPGVSGQTLNKVTVSGCGKSGIHMLHVNGTAGENVLTNVTSFGNGTNSGGYGIALSSTVHINISVVNSEGNKWGDLVILASDSW
ncbi:MAG: hypothetical protein GC205_04880 [Bacteroidetes bacterium]|nr:hypothetical protein [Bacteroidota bacterium]